MSWSTMTMVVPASRIARSRPASQRLSVTSSPAAGSSSKTIAGRPASARATETSWRWPTDSCRTGWSATACKSRTLKYASMPAAGVLPVRAGGARRHRADLDILPDAEVVVELDALERPAQPVPAAPVRLEPVQLAPVKLDRAGGTGVPADRVEQGSLPRAVRADQADDLAGEHLEAHVLVRDHAAVAHAHTRDRQQRAGRTRPAGRAWQAAQPPPPRRLPPPRRHQRARRHRRARRLRRACRHRRPGQGSGARGASPAGPRAGSAAARRFPRG